MHPTIVSRPLAASFLGRMGALVACLAVAATPALAAAIQGTVRQPGGDPAHEVRILLVETKQTAFSDDNGAFTFEDVAPGYYHLHAISRGLGSAVAELMVVEGDNAVTLELSVSPHKETIIVSATRSGAGSDEVVQPANVLDGVAIAKKMQPTLGELLGKEPGVSQSYFGAGASRPIIRGLEGGRVRMLEDGLGTGDVSDASPDHAVSVDPVLAEQIEVLRGPATLLYGSSAVGGVVNVIDRRVPEQLPQNPMTGTLTFRLGSVANERMGAADLNGHAGSLGWHLDAAVRDTDDYDIPGSADVNGMGPTGTLPNSDLESRKFTGGLSWVFDGKGFVGAALTRFDTTYGVPGGAHEEGEDGAEEGGPRIDLEQTKIDLRGGIDMPFGPFSGVDFSFANADYQHSELEETEIASMFESDYFESRIEIHNGAGGKLRGTSGLQYIDRDTIVSGAEAFLPPNRVRNSALFALQRLRTGPLNWELGLRFESQQNRADQSAARPAAAPPLRDRDFDGGAGSLGLLYRWGEGWGVGGSLTYADRLPNNEELYSYGQHLSTNSFEIGDPALDKETARGAELIVRKTEGEVFTGSLNLFRTDFSDYIYLEQQLDGNGDPLEMDGLPVFEYQHGDTEFYGFELELLFGLLHSERTDLDLVVRADRTTAELSDTGAALPRIPPRRYTLGLDYRGSNWSATAEVLHRDAVTGSAVAPSATPTESSTVFNASVSRRFVGRGAVHTLMLRGTNLTDEDVRLNTSRLKDTVPLPGVDISLIYRLQY